MKIVDYSFARPPIQAIKDAGYQGVARYLAPLPNAKAITKSEADALAAAGLSLVLVWESTADRATQGTQAGAADTQEAERQADQLGYPAGATIYYAVDEDVTPDKVRAYFNGVRSTARRPVGGYGSFQIVEALLDWGLIDRAWQTVAWSHGQHSARAVLYQRVGSVLDGTSDENDVLKDDWGQWPTASQQENDMTPDDRAQLDNVRADVDTLIGEFRAFRSDVYANFLMVRGVQPDPQGHPVTAQQVDPVALAAAIEGALSPQVAKQVADELAKRLAA